MGLQPNLQKKKSFVMKTCTKCGQSFGAEGFAPTKSIFYPDGTIPMCNTCVDQELARHDWDWGGIDKFCQMIDIPFVPKEWERLAEMNNQEVFYRYAQVFMGNEYEGIGWSDYYKAFVELRESGRLEEELPEIAERKRADLKEKWGKNYDDEALQYLDDLYRGLLATQNVNGKLQKDQAEKICKISYEIDLRIREGSDFDKLLASYDKLVKAADFTPKNVKNINDFDTCGELIKWLERKGWVNKYYDNIPRDIVDETIANIQAFNQRLYTNESGIGDEITKRLNSLKQAEQLERGDYYATGTEIEDLDSYEVDGYDKLLKTQDEEFAADVEEDEE